MFLLSIGKPIACKFVGDGDRYICCGYLEAWGHRLSYHIVLWILLKLNGVRLSVADELTVQLWQGRVLNSAQLVFLQGFY